MGFVSFIIYLSLIAFWTIIGWRMMRATERLADAAEKIGAKQP